MTNTITKITLDGNDYEVWTWDVVWPASATNWHLAVFSWPTWKKIKDWWAMPTNVSAFTNDAGYLKSSTWVTSVNGSHWAVTISLPTTITVTLTAIWWNTNTQIVSATWVTASNTVIVSPDPSDYSDYTDAGIYCSSQWSGILIFTCGTTPSNDIDVNVVILS